MQKPQNQLETAENVTSHAASSDAFNDSWPELHVAQDNEDNVSHLPTQPPQNASKMVGRAAKFGFEEVARVCEQLQAEGKLTLDQVRRRLGGGSNTTLLRHYQAWRGKQLKPLQVSQQLGAILSAELAAAEQKGAKAQEQLFTEQWQYAQNAISQLEEQVAQLQQQLDDAQQSSHRLETALAAAEQAHAALQVTLQVEKAHQVGLAEQLRDKTDSALAAHQQVEQVQAELAQVRAQQQSLIEQAQQHAVNAAVLNQENRSLRESLAQWQQRCEQCEQAHAQGQQQQQAIMQQLAQEQSQQQWHKKQLGLAKKQLLHLKERLAGERKKQKLLRRALLRAQMLPVVKKLPG